jgi:hypothetical protein
MWSEAGGVMQQLKAQWDFSRLVQVLLVTNFPQFETVMPPHQDSAKRENKAVLPRRTEVSGEDTVSTRV